MRASFALLALLCSAASAQPTGAELVTSDLVRPMGLEADAQGRIWVADAGTGQSVDDGQISVVLPNGQVFPFLVGLPSVPFPEGTRSVSHLALIGDELWFTVSAAGGLNTTLNRISTAGFTPGDPPRTVADIALVVNVGAFLGGLGYTVSNPYGIAGGPDGNIYFTDSAANVLLRYDVAGAALSVRTVFPASPNFSEAVPTGIVATDGRLYVSQLTGFPFAPGIARVFAVELDGTFVTHEDGYTALTDIALDPRAGGAFTVLQHGDFALDPPPPHWLPNTGIATRIEDDRVLASAFDLAVGAVYDASGLLYVSTLGGSLYRVMSNPVASDAPPPQEGVVLHQPEPNPVADRALVRYSLERASEIRLSVHDALGREVALVSDGMMPAGTGTATLDVSRLRAGAYLLHLRAGHHIRTLILTVTR